MDFTLSVLFLLGTGLQGRVGNNLHFFGVVMKTIFGELTFLPGARWPWLLRHADKSEIEKSCFLQIGCFFLGCMILTAVGCLQLLRVVFLQGVRRAAELRGAWLCCCSIAARPGSPSSSLGFAAGQSLVTWAGVLVNGRGLTCHLFSPCVVKVYNNSTVRDTQVLAACAQGSEGTNVYILQTEIFLLCR